jgi:hypothetical protein
MPNYFMHAVVPWTDLFSARTLMAARLVASTVLPSASLASEFLSKSQGWLLCPPTPWALTASFLYWRSLGGKNFGSASALSGFPLRFVKQMPATQAILDDHASPHGRHGR